MRNAAEEISFSLDRGRDSAEGFGSSDQISLRAVYSIGCICLSQSRNRTKGMSASPSGSVSDLLGSFIFFDDPLSEKGQRNKSKENGGSSRPLDL